MSHHHFVISWYFNSTGCLGFGFGLNWFCFGQRDVGITYLFYRCDASYRPGYVYSPVWRLERKYRQLAESTFSYTYSKVWNLNALVDTYLTYALKTPNTNIKPKHYKPKTTCKQITTQLRQSVTCRKIGNKTPTWIRKFVHFRMVLLFAFLLCSGLGSKVRFDPRWPRGSEISLQLRPFWQQFRFTWDSGNCYSSWTVLYYPWAILGGIKFG